MEFDVSKNKKSSLGKGLGSLLGETSQLEQHSSLQNQVNPSSTGKLDFTELDLELIESNPAQPRKSFSAPEMDQLVESVSQDGVLQPIIVAPHESQKNRYILVAGERRLRASKLANRKTIPAIVKNVANNQLLRLALIENIQRSDLNVIEESQAYESLISEHGLTQDECAKQVGKDRSTIANALRILALPVPVKDDLVNKKLSMGHARALAGLKVEADIETVRALIHKKQLSVRQTELLCRNLKSGKTLNVPGKETNPDLEYLAERLRSHLRTKVKLAGNPNRGKIEISFFSPTELDRILAAIGYQ